MAPPARRVIGRAGQRRVVGRSGPSTRTAPTVRRQPVHGGPAAVKAEAARVAQVAEGKIEGAPPPKPKLSAGRIAIQAFRINPVKPIGTRKINMLVYGPYGHGKTTFAGSALDVPEMCDVLFIAAEPGDMSLTSRRTLDIITINKYDQVARIFDYLTLHCLWRDEGNTDKLLEYERELKSDLVPVQDQVTVDFYGNEVGIDPERTWFIEQRYRSGKAMDEPYLYRTVIIDSLSEVHKYLVYKYTGVDIGTTKLDEEIEKMEEWQPAQELFRLFIRSFRDLPMNAIFVSAENLAGRDIKKGRLKDQMLPALAGQMAGAVAGFIDIVGYLVREILPGGETHRYLYLGAGYEGWISKHRFDNLPDLDYVDSPSISSLFELARKDAEYATSQARPAAGSSPVTPSRNAASTAASNRRVKAIAPTGRRR